MAENRQWNFTSDGYITDGVNSIKFSELTKYNPTTGRVEKIDGTAVPIGVTSADQLEGSTKSEFLMKSETSINGKGIISGSIDFNTNDMEEVVNTALVNYVGCGMHPNVPMTGLELLPNVTFDNANNVIVENAANVSVSANKLRVTKSTVDNPVVYQNVTLEAGKVYRGKVTRYNVGANVTTMLSIVDNGGTVLMSKTCAVADLVIDFGFTCVTGGVYKIKLTTYSTVASVGCEYYNHSVREIAVNALSYGQYVTYKDSNGIPYTDINTGIESKSLVYDPTISYSNAMYNNLAFVHDSFDLLQYIGSTPGKTGFIKDGSNNDIEYMKDANGKWIGDFKSLTVGEANSYISLFGSGSKSIDGTSGLLTVQRTAIDNVNPQLKIAIPYTGVAAGGYYFIQFYIEDIVGEWYADIYNGSSTVRYYLTNADPSDIGSINGVTYKRNSFVESRTVRLVVKSQGLPCVVNILRDNILNNPIALTDKISIKNLSVKALDAAVWKVLTPANRFETSPMMDWKSSDVMALPNQNTLIPNMVGLSNGVRFMTSVIGNGTVIGASGNWYKYKSLAGNTQGSIYNDGEYCVFLNKGIRLHAGGLEMLNVATLDYSIYQTGYNKVRMYRDEFNKLQLIVSDPVSGVSQTLYQIAVTNKVLKQDIKHDLYEAPNVVICSVLNRAPSNTFAAGYQVYAKTKKDLDTKYGNNVNSYLDMEQLAYNLNYNTMATSGADFKQHYVQLKKDANSLTLPVSAYTAHEYGIGWFKSMCNNNFIKAVGHKGTNMPKILNSPFTPQLLINGCIHSTKNKKTILVNKLYGNDKFLVNDVTITAYAKPTYSVVSLLDNGVAFMEYNTSTTDGNAGCIEKFNAAPLQGTVGSPVWYHTLMFGTTNGQTFTTVKRPKPGSKLAISNLVVSSKTGTNSVVGNIYKATLINKNFGE